MLFLPIPTKEEKGRPEPLSPHDSAAGGSGVALSSRPRPSWEDASGISPATKNVCQLRGIPHVNLHHSTILSRFGNFYTFKLLYCDKKVQGNQGVRKFTRARAKWRLGKNSAALPCKFASGAVY